MQGRIVAVKRLSSRFKERIEELESEIFATCSLEHNNVTKLLDAYVGRNLQFLVYKYMQNKSLARALFGNVFSSDCTSFQ